MLQLQDTQRPANTGAAQRKKRDRKKREWRTEGMGMKDKSNNLRVVKRKVRGDKKVENYDG